MATPSCAVFPHAASRRAASIRSRARAGVEFESALAARVPVYAVVDFRLPGAQGVHVVSAVKTVSEHARIVVLPGHGSVPSAIEAIKRRVTYHLAKPAWIAQIEAAFDHFPAANGAERGHADVARSPSMGGHRARIARSRWPGVGRRACAVDASAHAAAKARQAAGHVLAEEVRGPAPPAQSRRRSRASTTIRFDQLAPGGRCASPWWPTIFRRATVSRSLTARP